VCFKKGLTLLYYRRNTKRIKMVPQCNKMLKYNVSFLRRSWFHGASYTVSFNCLPSSHLFLSVSIYIPPCSGTGFVLTPVTRESGSPLPHPSLWKPGFIQRLHHMRGIRVWTAYVPVPRAQVGEGLLYEDTSNRRWGKNRELSSHDAKEHRIINTWIQPSEAAPVSL
jgi:hypothetical protein